MAINSTDKPTIVDLTEGRELVINGIATAGYWGSQHVVCLSCSRAGAGPDGELRNEAAIVARLRFDNDMAKMLVEALTQQIAVLTAPPKETAN